MKGGLYFILGTVILSSFGCKKKEEKRVEYANDPNFRPTTTLVNALEASTDSWDCVYENNYIKAVVTEGTVENCSWYLISENDKVYLSNQLSQLLTIAGQYELHYTFIREGQVVDTLRQFEFNYCPVYLEFPNAFKPGGTEGYNTWGVRANGVAYYSCEICTDKDRKVFSTTSLEAKWDGTSGAGKEPSGTYKYKVRGAFKNGRLFEYTGTIELIR